MNTDGILEGIVSKARSEIKRILDQKIELVSYTKVSPQKYHVEDERKEIIILIKYHLIPNLSH